MRRSISNNFTIVGELIHEWREITLYHFMCKFYMRGSIFTNFAVVGWTCSWYRFKNI